MNNKKNAGSLSAPANKQKGKKICSCCKNEKKLLDFYLSYSPMYSLDHRIPVCKNCCKQSVLNSDGTIDYERFKKLLRNIDKPLYYDALESAVEAVVNENFSINLDDVKYYGSNILSKYFTIIAMKQDATKTYDDSEKEGFIHKNSTRTFNELNKIKEKYFGLCTFESELSEKNIGNLNDSDTPIIWSEQDVKNMEYAIDVIGYDPFEDYPEENRRFLFNSLSPYLEDDDNVDDVYKLSQIIQVVDNNNQIRIYNRKLANLDPIKDNEEIKALQTIKKDLVSNNDKIAKENEISVKNRSNKDAGKSTLTYLMRDLREKDFEKAEADYYDQLRSEGTQWAVSISQKAMLDHCVFDENDKKEIYENNLKLINDLYNELDDKKEEIRQLLKKIDDLKIELNLIKEKNGIL